MQASKSRYWAFIAYPESLPDEWMYFLEMTGCPYAVSPLHDMDIYDKDDPAGKYKKGDIKKPHYHVIIAWPGPTTQSAVVNRITMPLNQAIPIALISPQGYYKYLWHDDRNDKVQYDPRQIFLGNGFDILEYSELSKEAQRELVLGLCGFIRDKNIYTMCDLIDMLEEEAEWDMFDYARKHTIFFKAYIDDRWKKYIRPYEKSLEKDKEKGL